jgi:hypothetical protein
MRLIMCVTSKQWLLNFKNNTNLGLILMVAQNRKYYNLNIGILLMAKLVIKFLNLDGA